jgi:hypothetical protein
MKPIPAEKIIEGLSEDLQDLVVREAFVRHRRAGLAAGLAQAQAQEAALKEKKPGLFGGKGAKEEHEAALAKVRQDLAAYEGAIASCDTILKKTEKIIDTELENFFETQSEDFRKASAGQKFVPEWDRAVVLYFVSLKQLIMRLGIARNQMSSGYDRKANKFAPGALEAFVGAANAAKTLEAEAAIPNQIARKQREALGVEAAPSSPAPSAAALPYLGNKDLAKQVTALMTLTLEAAQAKITALIEDAEQLHQTGIPALQEGVAREHQAQLVAQKKLVDRAREEIRTLADGSVDPAHAEPVFAAMEARFVKLTG